MSAPVPAFVLPDVQALVDAFDRLCEANGMTAPECELLGAYLGKMPHGRSKYLSVLVGTPHEEAWFDG